MKQYIFRAIQLLLAVLILLPFISAIIPAAVLPFLLISAFCILICDLALEAIIALINLRLFDNSIYITTGTISLIFIADIKEALICLLIFRCFMLILELHYQSFKAKIFKVTNKLLPKEVKLCSETNEGHDKYSECNIISAPCTDLKPGDTIVLSPSEILPVDAVLLDSFALFTPVFSASVSAPLEFLQGDEIPGGFRLVSETPVVLSATAHYEDSTFIKYIRAFENSTNNYKESPGSVAFLPKVLIILGIIGAIISLFIPAVTKYSALLIFLTCCIFLPAENIIAFFSKMLFYLFHKGVLPSANLKKLAKTKAFYVSKSAVIKSSEYTVTSICPAHPGMDNQTLLKYAAQAMLPYAHTDIGNVLLKEYASELLLSDVTHTEKYPELGILTRYNKDTIHTGCKEFLISSGISDLPDFKDIESGAAINNTFIYISLNNSYIGYISLQAPFKSSYSDFFKFIIKNHLFMTIVLQNSPDVAQELITVRQKLQKKCRTSYVAYIDSKPTDCTLQSMSDYNIFLGPTAYCRENDFNDVTIIPNSFKSLLRTITLARKMYFTVNLYTIIILLIKAFLVTASFLLPGIKIWYVLLVDGVLCTILIKIYDFFFRLFTRLN